MRGINNVLILGRLGQDCTLEQSKSGSHYVDLSIATNRPIQRNGTWSTETDWHRVRFWNKQAERCVQFCQKGSPIAVEGALRTERWTTAEGEYRSKTYVIGSEFHLLPDGKINTALVPTKKEPAVLPLAKVKSKKKAL